ncbi:MAG: YraN family protein [Clostridia bacterium]|nr:YraN family protein [Clostridia bacterium]
MQILKIKTEKRKLGDLGEAAARRYLWWRGYRIHEKNYAVDETGEIDIIASRGDTLAFVEVKARSLEAASPMEPRPALAVTPEKQQKILSTSKIYVAFNPEVKGTRKMRFDIIEVLFKGGKVKKINHLKGAFDRGSAYLPPWKRK